MFSNFEIREGAPGLIIYQNARSNFSVSITDRSILRRARRAERQTYTRNIRHVYVVRYGTWKCP